MRRNRAPLVSALLSFSVRSTLGRGVHSAARHTHAPTPNKSFHSAAPPVRHSIDSLKAPRGDALTVSSAIEYLDQLRKIHRSLGVSPAASDIRWRAREFLHFIGLAPPTESWPMTGEFALAIVNASVHFEVVVFECPFGQRAVEYLVGLWKHRGAGGEGAICSTVNNNNNNVNDTWKTAGKEISCSDVSALGRLALAVLSQITNRTLGLHKSERLLLSQLLGEFLLPTVVQFLSTDFFLSSDSANAMSAAEAEAFSVLLAALTKAAVAKWARQEKSQIVFGPPPETNESDLLPSRTPEEIPDITHSAEGESVGRGVPILFSQLTRALERFTLDLSSVPLHGTALPVLRFFVFTHSLPVFVDDSALCGTDVTSVVSSLLKIFTALLDPKISLVSHQVSSVASTYAHVLAYNLTSTTCQTYTALWEKLRHEVLHGTEALSPVTVLLSLCERVIPDAKRYLFSDTAALLNAVAKMYRVVRTLHRSSPEISSPSPAPDLKVSKSRFERRRDTLPAKSPSPTFAAPEESALAPLSPPSLAVSREDLAEIEGELEAVLHTCVAVTTRHMPAAPGMKSRPAFLGMRKEDTEVVRIASSEAKERGGRSRLAKKTAGNRELIMIAEAVHALSWRHFAAFQERLYNELIASRGQSELRPAQYAACVCIVLRAPPALPSAVFHCVADRLKRVIHAESITSPLGEVISAEHVRPIHDYPPLSLHDACSVVFAFAQKLHGSSLSLLHDLLVRCSNRVLCNIKSPASDSLSSLPSNSSSASAACVVGYTMFIVSATRVLHADDVRRDSALQFIAAARDEAAAHVAALDAATVKTILSGEMSMSNLTYAALLLEKPNEGEPHDVHAVRELLRASFCTRAPECDCVELAQFLSEYFTSTASHMSLPPWMVEAMRLEKHFTCSKRLPVLTMLPLVVKDSDDKETSAMVMHALEVTRLYCRTFATLVAIVQIFSVADSALLVDASVLHVVLRKIAQLTRRTAYPQDLFLFFSLYGDCPEVVSACTSELVPESHCFLVNQTSATPLARVLAALRTIARLRSRALRQRWLSVLSPLIVQSVRVSSDVPDTVLDVAELVAADDPALLQSVLRSSRTIRGLRDSFSATAEGETLLRLLVLLQGGNPANPTVRELHKAAARVLEGPYHRTASVQHIAQAMMLPSLEGTVIARRLKRHFTLRVERILEGDGVSLEGGQRWVEALNKLEVDHWLTLLRFKSFGEKNSHRFEVEVQEYREETQKRRSNKPQTTETKKTTVPTTVANQSAMLHESNEPLLLEDSEVQKEIDMNVTRRHRGLFVVLGFTPSLVMSLRTSLGASHFIRFVNDLLRETAQVMGVDCTFAECSEKQTGDREEGFSQSYRLWMSDGTLSPLCHKGVRPFVSLATELVQAISEDLGSFVLHEQEIMNSQCKAKKTGKEDVLIDLEAILHFGLLMDMYNPALCEQRQLESYSAEDIFSCEKGLFLRYLYRLLQKLPSQWGCVATTTGKSSVRLCNISAVLDYSKKNSKESAFEDFVDKETFHSFRSELVDIFGGSRPLLLDVCMPIAEVRERQFRQRTLSKTYIFDALMQCLIHADEPPAATRSRLATLAPRDISRVVQAICGGTNTKQESSSAVADGAVDILTDMLPSSSAEDLHDVVRTLLPLLANNAAVETGTSLGIRRLLAHVAVVMGNDTERFPLPILYDILQRLHEPHALVSAAAARQMLAGLNAETESEAEKKEDVEVSRAANGTYMLTITLLRGIVSAEQHSADVGKTEMDELVGHEESVLGE